MHLRRRQRELAGVAAPHVQLRERNACVLFDNMQMWTMVEQLDEMAVRERLAYLKQSDELLRELKGELEPAPNVPKLLSADELAHVVERSRSIFFFWK